MMGRRMINCEKREAAVCGTLWQEVTLDRGRGAPSSVIIIIILSSTLVIAATHIGIIVDLVFESCSSVSANNWVNYQ